jgi:hypothetical protein
MKTFLTALLLFSGTIAYCQKSEDMTDTRQKREPFAKLPRNEVRDEVATFALSGIEESVGKAELRKIPVTAATPTELKMQKDTIKASVTIAPFDASKHKLDYDEKYLTRIDKKTYYGSYPNLPTTYISNISMVIGKDTVKIPPTAYFDLYDLKLTYRDKSGTPRSTDAVYVSKDGRRVYLYLYSKDEKNDSYEVTFVFQDKQYIRRILDYDMPN